MPKPADRPTRGLVGLLLSLALAACAGAATPGTTPSPSPPPSAPPSSSPASGAVVVTIRVDEETYRVRLTDPADIAIARDLAAGREGPRIPNGRVIRGEADVNAGYTWHIDPDDFDWADMTMELCDGRPSFVERGEISGDRYCPWSAVVVAVEPLP